MNDFPIRSGATDLSDDELLIFDALWWIHVPLHFLYSSVYSLHNNVAYSHSMSDDQTDETVQKLLDRKLIRRHEDSSDAFTLTELGGSLWETERSPNWRTHISDNGSYNQKRFSLVALDETIGRLYVAGMFAAGLIVPTSQIKCRTIHDYWLTPWKRVPTAKLIRVSIRGHEPFQYTNWNVYEKSRVWWRDINELNTLNRMA